MQQNTDPNLADLDERVALGNCHGILAGRDGIDEALEARGLRRLTRGWWTGLKGEVLCQACATDKCVVFFQLTIDHLQRRVIPMTMPYFDIGVS